MPGIRKDKALAWDRLEQVINTCVLLNTAIATPAAKSRVEAAIRPVKDTFLAIKAGSRIDARQVRRIAELVRCVILLERANSGVR
jgi:hypothetical protein